MATTFDFSREFNAHATHADWYRPSEYGHAQACRRLLLMREADPERFATELAEFDRVNDAAWMAVAGGRPVEHPPLRELLAAEEARAE